MVNIVQFWRAGSVSGATRVAVLAGVLVAGGLLAWAACLWPAWRENPDLSHGFLALPVLAMLWKRAREDSASGRARKQEWLSDGWVGLGVGLGLVGLAVATLFTTVYAVALGWGATPTLFFLSVVVASALGMATILATGQGVRWVRPGWPLVVMVAVVLLSAPLPPGSYARLTAGLQEMVTIGVVDTLRLFGVPALRAGNVIQLGSTAVGVEEACSGVRSLVSCVLGGLVLSALWLNSPWRRFWLVGLAAPLALAANFGRSLTLTLMARSGVDIAGMWHDMLGYAVLVPTMGLLAALACWLEEKSPGEVRVEQSPKATKGAEWSGVVAVAALMLAAGWFGFMGLRTQSNGGVSVAAPDLERLVPAVSPAGWRVETRRDLGRFAGILQTEHLLERTYSKVTDADETWQVTVYVAWWPAGGASVSTVAAHTPEACWPGAGWQAVPGAEQRGELALGQGVRVGEAEKRAFISRDYPQKVWFWHLVDGRPMRAFDPRSWREQLAVFWQRGVRREEAQAFVRISSNVEWERLASDPLLAKVVAGVAELGVPVSKR